MEEIVIKVEGVHKNFKLPHERSSTLKSAFTGIMHGKKKRTMEIQHALKDINFEIRKGEFFGIVGRNGSGKSTLLKILAGIYQPNKGKVRVEGRLVPFIELGVGFNGELTGRENVYLNGALLGFSKAEVDKMYKQIVDFAELGKFMDQKLKNYSSGMQVRLAFSLAIRAEADILLVDEVLAVGDADFQRKCFNYFKELKKQHKTVVFVSHDMSAVREYCDRAVLIEKSEIVVAGTANEVATQYVKLFNPNSNQSGKGNDNKKSKDRWGDGDAKYTELSTTLEKDKIQIHTKVKVSRDVNDPVFGYMIKDSAGNELFGTNSKLKHEKIGLLKKGETRELTWTVPNVLNDGIFFLALAISHNDGITQHDWWDNAEVLTVVREDKTPYALNPDSKFEFK